jgi:7-carboxy-7-deazaguanine synthase
LQGEGRLAGVPSTFIRLAGCPLRCRWCDTQYAWDKTAGQTMTNDAILEAACAYPTPYIIVTGGEPMVHLGIEALLGTLSGRFSHITVETAGLKFLPDLPVNLMSISPKLSNSRDKSRIQGLPAQQFDVVQRLISAYDYQLKFVVDIPQDLDEIAELLENLDGVDPRRVYLMPQATEPDEYMEKSRWLVEYCKQTGFSFSPRLQVMLWGGQRGK